MKKGMVIRMFAEKILFRMIKNDLKRNKSVSFILIIFTAMAAFLTASGLMMVLQLMSGTNFLMEKAQTPHFMQMHMGDIDMERVEEFGENNSLAESYQVLGFLNADNSEIRNGERTFAENVQDNGFCVQSDKFDYLLDMNSEIISAEAGEVYVPVSYREDGSVGLGDKMSVYGVPFKVAGFLRDSQMNSSLASSKRFIINEADFNKLKEYGNMEYLIEFRLKDLNLIRDFEQSYTNVQMEANGPTITWSQIKLFNAFSDGLMIAVIILVSAFLTGIIFMCLRFTILTQLEEDTREIGVMKAIGLELKDMKRLYYGKYMLLTGTGSILGFLLSLPFRNVFMAQIMIYTGADRKNGNAVFLGLIGAAVIFIFVAVFVQKTLSRIKRVSPAKALSNVEDAGKDGKDRGISLTRHAYMGSNVFLGVKDILVRKRTFISIFFVFVFATFIIIIPTNMFSTINNPDFMRYMGVGDCDVRIDVQQTDRLEEKMNTVLNALENDREAVEYAVLGTGTYTILREDGAGEGIKENIKIETGNHKVFPIEYISGTMPVEEDEIALSVMNADEMEKAVGDSLTLLTHDGEKQLKICGIYSDITNGGKTAKAAFTNASDKVMWYVINVDFTEGTDADKKVVEYQGCAEGIKVTRMQVYMNKTLGNIITGMEMATAVAYVIAVLIIILTVSLFLRLLIAKDSFSIAVLKSLGFSKGDIRMQYGVRFAIILLLGMVIGTVMANTIGKSLAGMLLSGLGVSDFAFLINGWVSYLLIPILLMVCVIVTVMAATDTVGNIKIADSIKE